MLRCRVGGKPEHVQDQTSRPAYCSSLAQGPESDGRKPAVRCSAWWALIISRQAVFPSGER